MPEVLARRVKGYGWRSDHPDARDMPYLARRRATDLPPSADLRPRCPPVYDQGQLGSCTANAIAGALEYDALTGGADAPVTPSRLFIYYYERRMEGTAGQDAGAEIRDGIKVVAAMGAPQERLWPYSDADPGLFTVKPPDQILAEALRHQLIDYRRASTLDDFRDALAAGFPVALGITVYSSFESEAVAKTGDVPMPDTLTERVLGGHAVLAVGYDDRAQRLWVRNSWGSDWGRAGYFTLPYRFVTDRGYSDDYWVIRRVQGERS